MRREIPQTIPKGRALYNPVLRAIKSIGRPCSNHEIEMQVAKMMRLSSDVVQFPHSPGKGKKTEIGYRMDWCRTNLKKYGALQNTDRGRWWLTEMGRRIEEVDPREVIRIATGKSTSVTETATPGERPGGSNGKTSAPGAVDLAPIRKIYATDPVAKASFDLFATRQRNQRTTTVERLRVLLVMEGQNVSDAEVRHFLQRLAYLGCGQFKVGRRGQPSRMEWKVRIISLGRAAADSRAELEALTEDEMNDGIGDPMEPTSDSIDAKSSEWKVRYPLRQDHNIELLLPKNLTSKEVQRLADFIKTLPCQEVA